MSSILKSIKRFCTNLFCANNPEFKKAFGSYAEAFNIVGGTRYHEAIIQNIGQVGTANDVDLILAIGQMTPDFANAIGKFVSEGEYTHRVRLRSGTQPQGAAYEVYRFEGGQNNFPAKIEIIGYGIDLLGQRLGLVSTVADGRLGKIAEVLKDRKYFDEAISKKFCSSGFYYAISPMMGLIEIRDYLNLQEAFMSWKATATLQDSKISILDSKDINEDVVKERLRDVAHMVKQLGIDTSAIASDKIRNDVALFASVAKEVLDIDIYSPNNKTNTNVDYDWGGISSDVDGD